MKKTISIYGIAIIVLLLTALAACKKDTNSSGSGNYVLSITTGAQSIAPQQSIAYTAVLVDKTGNTTPATGVTWSVSNGALGTFSGGTFTASGIGTGKITASVSKDGVTYTASMPIGVSNVTLFTVVPSAIIWTTGSGNIDLTSVYLGNAGSPSFTYTSSNSSVATVSSTGSVSFTGTGECTITVTANGLQGNPTVTVPVLVVGAPGLSLPVSRVVIDPASKNLFRNGQFTFTAKSYNSADQLVTSNFTWAVQDPAIATIDQTGKVTAKSIGKTVITAMASGITGQAEVNVYPDTIIEVSPFYASVPAGRTKQFTATEYKVNSNLSLTAIPASGTIHWEIPTYGISMLDVATVDQNGLVTMRSNATMGLATVVTASISSVTTIEPGVGMLIVGIQLDTCACGPGDAGVADISGVPATMNFSLLSPIPQTINAQAVDAGTNPVSGANLVYCSDNALVCSVSSGSVIPTGIGSATVTVCNGSIRKTIAVTVTQ